jgi:hypothetical protein
MSHNGLDIMTTRNMVAGGPPVILFGGKFINENQKKSPVLKGLACFPASPLCPQSRPVEGPGFLGMQRFIHTADSFLRCHATRSRNKLAPLHFVVLSGAISLSLWYVVQTPSEKLLSL